MLLDFSLDNIAFASKLIAEGDIVAFPTETVYGLGADAFNPRAVARIFELKGRPQDNPLIVHIADIADIAKVVDQKALTNTAKQLLKILPAPLTLVCKRNPNIPDIVTAGLDTVAVRIPTNAEARQFISACKTPLAAPSANTSTRPSPTCAMHVVEDFGDKIIVLDGGNCQFGLESTVVDVTSETAIILRSGSFTKEQLQQYVQVADNQSTQSIPKSPGTKYKHYAPACPLYTVKYTTDMEATTRTLYQQLKNEGSNPIIITESNRYTDLNVIHLPNYAEGLYRALRTAEKSHNAIIAEYTKDEGMGIAVNNRLQKASIKLI